MANEPIKVPMTLNSEKKHSIRYDAIDQVNGALQSAYVSRKALPAKIPNNITITIEIPSWD